MMIAVEGMDGVGKTAISRYICQQYGFDFIEKPLHYFYNDDAKNGYADLMNAANRMYDINDNMIKSWFFSLGNLYVSRMYKDKNVVIDRHLVSNYYWNGDLKSEPIFSTLIEISGIPDLTIILYATPKTRFERLRKRNIEDPDLNDPDKMDDGYDKMIYFVDKFKLPYIIINTENKNLEEVEQIVDIEISKLNNKEKKMIKKKELNF